MAKARVKLNQKLLNYSRSEWLNLINEYIKDKTDRIIAERYFLDGIPQIDIAEEVNYSRSTIKKRIPKILNLIEKSTIK